MRAGDPFSQVVSFDEGFPDANITWVLRDGDGAQVTTGTITPTAGDVSASILVSGSFNTVSGSDLFSWRELSWSYLVDGALVSGQVRYRVEAFLKFGVSTNGVRTKLGVEPHEVEDTEIDLVGAYASFQDTITTAALNAVTDGYAKLLISDAIEALAALKLLPSLQVKIASKEISGVSQFQRAKINWDDLLAQLNDMVALGYTAVNPDIDLTTLAGSSFLVVTRTDPITGV